MELLPNPRPIIGPQTHFDIRVRRKMHPVRAALCAGAKGPHAPAGVRRMRELCSSGGYPAGLVH
jgi:hypothetical protein